MHDYDAAGLIRSIEIQRPYDRRPVFLAGSGGLVSTARDYWRFCQMCASGGALGGARVLRPETVLLMRENVLEPGVMIDTYGRPQLGEGFGMDFAVINDPAAGGNRQGPGTYYWGGAFGTWFWIDPTNDLIVIGMIQNVNGTLPWGPTPNVRRISADHVYDAIGA